MSGEQNLAFDPSETGIGVSYLKAYQKKLLFIVPSDKCEIKRFSLRYFFIFISRLNYLEGKVHDHTHCNFFDCAMKRDKVPKIFLNLSFQLEKV